MLSSQKKGSIMLLHVFAIICAYLIGSLSSSIILCKLFQLPDPRLQGSGNAGATNVLRFARKKIAILVLVGDVLKGVFVVLVANTFIHTETIIGIMAVAVVLGHIFPVFFNFKGAGTRVFLPICSNKGLMTHFHMMCMSCEWCVSIPLAFICVEIYTRNKCNMFAGCWPAAGTSRLSSKRSLIIFLKLLIFQFFVVYCIWEDLAAWKILLQCVPTICLQFWEFPKMPRNREV